MSRFKLCISGVALKIMEGFLRFLILTLFEEFVSLLICFEKSILDHFLDFCACLNQVNFC